MSPDRPQNQITRSNSSPAPRWCIAAPPVRGCLSTNPKSRKQFFEFSDRKSEQFAREVKRRSDWINTQAGNGSEYSRLPSLTHSGRTPFRLRRRRPHPAAALPRFACAGRNHPSSRSVRRMILPVAVIGRLSR